MEVTQELIAAVNAETGLPSAGIVDEANVNVLAEMPEGAPLIEAPTQQLDLSPATCAEEVERVFGGAIVQYANELWARDSSGRWRICTNKVKKKLLGWYRSEPTKTGRMSALYTQCAVDPDNETCSNYYARDNAAAPWCALLPDVNEIMCRTGVYDVRTRKFEPYAGEKIVFGPLIDVVPDETILAAVRAGDYATAPVKFRELVTMINYALVEDVETVQYFQQIVGQVLRPHCGWNQFCHIYGESGARKTTIMRALLAAPCGPSGYNEISEHLLADRPFTRPGLVNRIANLSNDSASTRQFAAFIKEVTGGVIQVEKKFHDSAKVGMTAKLFATMNTAQDYSDASLGVENRLIAFRFKARTDNDRSAAGCQWMQPTWYDEADRNWVVHWLLVGLERCYVDGKEVEPKPSELATKWKHELLNESGGVRSFVSENLVLDPEARPVAVAEVLDRAVQVAACDPDKRHTFAKELSAFLKQRHNVKADLMRVDGKPTRVYRGLLLRAAV